MSEIGFYSLVRYIDDLDRGETINVGTLLEVHGRVFMRFVERDQLESKNSSVRRFEELLQEVFRTSAVDPEANAEVSPLTALADRRFPHFALTAPRQVQVDDPESTIETLTRRLVDEPVASASRW